MDWFDLSESEWCGLKASIGKLDPGSSFHLTQKSKDVIIMKNDASVMALKQLGGKLIFFF